MITRGLIAALGVSQLVCWGVTYYLVAVFGTPIARETGWSLTLVHAGFSVALVVMGLVSGVVGRHVDRRGGRAVMSAGSILGALGCLGLAGSHHLATYFLSWVVLGLAMRMTLYDAAFATLARIGGSQARRPISQITLLGGLASTVLWPIGEALIGALGWRWALVCYAGLALATLPLHLMIPSKRFAQPVADGPAVTAPLANTPRRRIGAGVLFAALVTLSSFLNSAMSAHMIAILSGLGMAGALAVWTATLRGVGQSSARLCEILFGRRLDPLALGILATAILPFAFWLGFFSGTSLAAGIGFALLYGAGNGLVTIVRGTQPLVLFDPASYGAIAGRLIGPSFFLSACAPIAYAFVIERYGNAAALGLSTGVAVAVAACAVALWAIMRWPVVKPAP